MKKHSPSGGAFPCSPALITVGIVAIGPWLTRLVSQIALHQARSAAAVIAASRIKKTPVATFRSVSGLVIAVFVVYVFAGAASIIEPTEAAPSRPGLLQPGSLHATLGAGTTSTTEATETARNGSEVPGVLNATLGYGPAVLSARDAGPEIYLRATDALGLG